ncbi:MULTISPECIES: glycosyltransferase [Vibrio]|uniref:glycosyltransferase n=1 Tax=Vibrio TaxID=662 RepID=UPI00107F0C79|nr:glycosyltransferase [Vibrio tasmaniensis]
MKISLISHSDTDGGAARAAFRIHEALNRLQVDSTLFVNVKNSEDSKTRLISKNSFSKIIDRLSSIILRLQVTSNRVTHSTNLTGSRVFDIVETHDCDIVNIHWVNQGTLSIRQIGRFTKPTVLTLHDMWAFSGTEHYVIDNNKSRFKIGYDETELSNSEEQVKGIDINRFVWRLKCKFWGERLTIVTGSRWLSNMARDSQLFSKNKVITIPNALDTNLFTPSNRNSARLKLDLPVSKVIIGFGAISSDEDQRKGYDLLVDALSEISLNNNSLEIECAVFGSRDKGKGSVGGVATTFLGHINDDSTLVQFYNAIDVMVVPSRQDHMPQTGTESLSCGTPVVAFDISGLPDVVTHQETGYLAKPFCTKDLAAGIIWCIDNNSSHNLSHNSRKKALDLWSYDIVAKQYLDLFESIR